MAIVRAHPFPLILTALSARARRAGAWVALVAMLLASGAPVATRLLHAIDGTTPSFSEICSASGARQGHEPGTPVSDHEGLCPFCVIHAVAATLPPAHYQWITTSLAAFAPPQAAHQPNQRPIARIAAQPRGPPPIA